MKKNMLRVLLALAIVLGFTAASPAFAVSTVTVVSDTDVAIVGVYNKSGGPANFVDLSATPLPAVRAQEPKPYPSGYVSEGPEVTGSVWDTGVNWSFETNAPAADWIWETERAEGPASYDPVDPLYDPAAYTHGRVVVFEKKFDILGTPEEGGVIRISADNAWEVRVNGQFVARSSTAKVAGWESTELKEDAVATTGWQNVGDVSIPASVLVSGENTLTILAANEYFFADDGNTPSPALNESPYYQYNPGAAIFAMTVPYEEEVPSALVVTKTAETKFTRTYAWAIDKEVTDPADGTLSLMQGDAYVAHYKVNVTPTPTDSEWTVFGEITIENPNLVHPAMITDVLDAVGEGEFISVECPFVMPYELAPGASVTCTYSGVVPNAEDGINEATVETEGVVSGGSDTANFSFAEVAPEEVDRCIDVSDSLAGVLGEVCANAGEFTYTYPVGPYNAPGEYMLENTASFVAEDTGATGSDDATITIMVSGLGCTLTQGYWKTHSEHGPAAHPNDAWEGLVDAIFFSSGNTYHDVLWMPNKGNAYYQLAHQYIAAKLNVENGAWAPASVASAIADAEALFGTYTPGQVAGLKGNNAVRKQFVALAGLLGSYNEGAVGPGHCDEEGILTGTWLLSVNGGAYMHDMLITETVGGVLSGSGGYPAGGAPYAYPYNWTLAGQVTGSAVSMTITYQNGYTATISGTVAPSHDSMSGGAGTGGVTDWSATRVL